MIHALSYEANKFLRLHQIDITMDGADVLERGTSL